jgi:hypothetical protein
LESKELKTPESILAKREQADASKRRPVRVSTQYFPGFARVGPVSDSPRHDVSTHPGANRLGCLVCLW